MGKNIINFIINNNGGNNTIIGQTIDALPLISQSQENTSFQDNCKKILWILSENKRIWEEFGPESAIAKKEPFNENVAKHWKEEKIRTIIPNNNEIISIIDKNMSSFDIEDFGILSLFKTHCKSFESSCLDRQEKQIRFPTKFIEVIKKYV